MRNKNSEIQSSNAELVIEELTKRLAGRYGRPRQDRSARIITFGQTLTCSVNYSKLLRGNKYFFGLPAGILSSAGALPETTLGTFVLLICGSADRVLVLPGALIIEMMEGVSSRRLDIFLEDGAYILQTTRHPKRNVTDYLNAFPAAGQVPPQGDELNRMAAPDRIHVRVQFNLIMLGRAEGCSVWIPINDRNLSYRSNAFSLHTIPRLPNFGFEENTKRIIQNIDVLWLSGNVIRKAFEIESTTSVYSGLLRLNDLVLAQPNIQIDLFVAAARARRERVYTQLLRPSFQSLVQKCAFVSFEDIEAQMEHVRALSIAKGARVSGLIRGEKFKIPDHVVYPSGV